MLATTVPNSDNKSRGSIESGQRRRLRKRYLKLMLAITALIVMLIIGVVIYFHYFCRSTNKMTSSESHLVKALDVPNSSSDAFNRPSADTKERPPLPKRTVIKRSSIDGRPPRPNSWTINRPSSIVERHSRPNPISDSKDRFRTRFVSFPPIITDQEATTSTITDPNRMTARELCDHRVDLAKQVVNDFTKETWSKYAQARDLFLKKFDGKHNECRASEQQIDRILSPAIKNFTSNLSDDLEKLLSQYKQLSKSQALQSNAKYVKQVRELRSQWKQRYEWSLDLITPSIERPPLERIDEFLAKLP